MKLKIIILLGVLAGIVLAGFEVSGVRNLVTAVRDDPSANKNVECANIEMNEADCLLMHPSSGASRITRWLLRLDVPTLWGINFMLLAALGVVVSCFLLIYLKAQPQTLGYGRIALRFLLGVIAGFICFQAAKLLPAPTLVLQFASDAGRGLSSGTLPTTEDVANQLYSRCELFPVLAGLFISHFYQNLESLLDPLMSKVGS